MNNINIIDVALTFGSMAARKTTDRIIIHHAAARTCTVQQIHQWHLNNGWSGIGYHFFIRKDGSIYRGRPEHTVGCHASGGNYNSLGVCFEGDYMAEHTMPKAQLKSGNALVAHLKHRYIIKAVQKHLQVSDTDCPGLYFPFLQIIDANGAIISPNTPPAPPSSTDDTELLRIDGWWGPSTSSALQKIFAQKGCHIIIDGKISNQWACYQPDNPGLEQSSWEFAEHPNGKGSMLIKAMQTWAEMPKENCDGEAGPSTFSAFQKKLRALGHNLVIDGKVSGPSMMVKALQQWANKQ